VTGKHLTYGLQKWSARPEWQDNFTELLARHLEPVCERFDLDEDSFWHLFPEGFEMVMMTYVFEDLVTETFPDGRNLADEYLKRRGWKESATTRNYIRALKESRIRIYEISGIEKNRGFFARDILEKADPVWVSEKLGTHYLLPWDQVAGRLLNVNGKVQFSGGMLRLDQGMVDEILEAVNLMSEMGENDLIQMIEEINKRNDVPELSSAIEKLRNSDVDLPKVADVMDSLAVLCSDIYLQHTVLHILEPDIPTFVNTDGDLIEWHEVRFPLRQGVTQAKIRPDICAIPDLQMETAKFWNWLEGEMRAHKQENNGQNIRIFSSTMDSGETVLGNVELKGRDLLLTANSAERAERGASMIATALAGKVGEPVTRIVEPDDYDHASEADRLPSRDDPELYEVQIEMANQYYRQLIDQPVPALGQKTPRELSKSRDSKDIAELVTWVKRIENHLASNPAGSPLREVDVSWMWDELGISPL